MGMGTGEWVRLIIKFGDVCFWVWVLVFVGLGLRSYFTRQCGVKRGEREPLD